MKIRIKTYNGELPSYLTMGKDYQSYAKDDIFINIVDDDGNERVVFISECAHLNGGSWEVVNE